MSGTKSSLGGTSSTPPGRRGRRPASLIDASSNTPTKENVMSTSITARAAGSRRKFALLMLTGSLGCALGVGTAVAQTSDNDVPRIVLHYTAQTLATDN